jgi:hypothetical protein
VRWGSARRVCPEVAVVDAWLVMPPPCLLLPEGFSDRDGSPARGSTDLPGVLDVKDRFRGTVSSVGFGSAFCNQTLIA